jgi:hypothetical protein
MPDTTGQMPWISRSDVFSGVPVGAIIAFAGPVQFTDTPSVGPAGAGGEPVNLALTAWRVCNGDDLKIIEYPELFETIGTIYGGQESNGTFCLPCYEGYFLRAVDPDANSAANERRDPPKGKSGERYTGVGSTQKDALRSHTHKLGVMPPVTGQSGAAKGVANGNTLSTTGPFPEDIVSELETRPCNVNVYWLIKCRSG